MGNGEYLWTDVAEIAERGLIRESAASLWHAILHGIDGHYWRPTVFALHSLEFWAHGAAPLAFRLTNLLLHFANVALVCTAIRRVLNRTDLAVPAAALFAVHPLAVTPIAWVSDRTDLLGLLGALGACLCAHNYVQTRRVGSLLGSLAALAVGLGAKETAAAAILVCSGALLCAEPASRQAMARVVAAQVALFAVWAAWRTLVTTNPVARSRVLDIVPRVALAARIHFEYATDLVATLTMRCCDAVRVPADPRLWSFLGMTAVATLALLAWSSWRGGHRVPLIAAAWSLAFMLPTSGVVALKHVRADRYLYAAMPGLLLLATWTGQRVLAGVQREHARITHLAFVVAYAWLAACLAVRVERFRSNDALWTWEVAREPYCKEGLANLARTAYVAGDFERASYWLARLDAAHDRAVVGYWDAGVLYYEGLLWIRAGKPDAARESFLQVLASGSDRAKDAAALQIALLALARNDSVEATRLLNIAIAGGDALTLPDALLLRAWIRARSGKHAEARLDFARYASLAEHTKFTPVRAKLDAELRAMLGIP